MVDLIAVEKNIEILRVENTRLMVTALRKNVAGAGILFTTYSCVVLLEIIFLYEFGIGNFQVAYTIGTIYLIIIG